jgi:hypothetical protein
VPKLTSFSTVALSCPALTGEMIARNFASGDNGDTAAVKRVADTTKKTS